MHYGLVLEIPFPEEKLAKCPSAWAVQVIAFSTLAKSSNHVAGQSPLSTVWQRTL